MRIQIRMLLFIKVKRTCNYWSTYRPGLHFQPLGFHLERPRSFKVPFRASKAPQLHFIAEPVLASQNNGIHADPDPEPWLVLWWVLTSLLTHNDKNINYTVYQFYVRCFIYLSVARISSSFTPSLLKRPPCITNTCDTYRTIGTRYLHVSDHYQFWIGSKQCCGYMKVWCGSGSADPYLWLMDPDPDPALGHGPACFVSDLQDINKKLSFCLLHLEGTFTSFFFQR